LKVLLLIPHKLAGDRHLAVRKSERPQADYDALAEELRAVYGAQVDILDLNMVASDRGWMVRLVRRLFGFNWALAMLGYQRCGRYDAVFAHSEIVGLPFAMLISTMSRRPRFAMNAYYITGKRNALWYRVFRAHRHIDKIFTLVRRQYDAAREELRISESKLVQLNTCGFVDAKFFGAALTQTVNENQICSAGLEFRDYETLLKAVARLPDVKLKIDPGSPWSLHKSGIDRMSIPPNAEICHMEMGAVRHLYAESAAVVIPLFINPIGAGMTTLVEAMSMGKPVIVTRSKDNTYAGMTDIIDGDNVLLVNAGDVDGLSKAIERVIGDAELRRRIGANGRKWAEEHAGRQPWLDIVVSALGGSAWSENHRGRPEAGLGHLCGD